MLVVEVKTKGDFVPAQSDRATMETGAMTIGRSSENDLVLPDPTGAISRQHCRIEHTNGDYHLTDTSTNGVFLNASGEKVGRGNSVVLTDGDQISIGHYQLEVQVAGDEAAAPESRSADLEADPFQDLPGPLGKVPQEQHDDLLGPLPRQAPLEEEMLGEEAVAWDIDAPEGSEDAKEATFSGFQQIGIEQDALDPFNTTPQDQIPADWDEHLTTEPPSGATGQPGRQDEQWFADEQPGQPRAEAEIQAQAGAPPAPRDGGARQAAPQVASLDAAPRPDSGPMPGGSGRSESDAYKAFLSGAGLTRAAELQGADPVETMRLLGKIYRDVVVGLRGLLEARRVIKSELKMSQTIIQQSGNNPLKWSLSDEEAVESLLGQGQRGRLPPQEAIQEAFDDLNTHQIAMVVGMQRAIAVLLKRFDPKALEARIESANTVSKLMPGLKSRYWEEFTRLYAEIAQEAEEDFDNLFGREFAKAYEERVLQMTGKASASPIRSLGRGADREK